MALYLRISTDEEHQPFSLVAQRLKLEAFVPTQPGGSTPPPTRTR